MTTPNPPQPLSPPPNSPGFVSRQLNRVPDQARYVSVPKPLPQFLGARPIIFYSWIGAIILVCFDEWHTNNILPRPSRLWYTTLVYGMLTMLSIVDPLVGIANALAMGYTITLYYQYFNSSGQFTAETTAGGTSSGQSS